MKLISNAKWVISELPIANQVREWLLQNGGKDVEAKGNYEEWRIKYSDTTFTYYTSGTLFVTDSDDGSVLEAHSYINGLVEPKFLRSDRKYLIGFDETGKGEIFGHLILVGVLLDNSVAGEITREIGVADSKAAHSLEYWEQLFNKIDYYRTTKQLDFYIEKIPPWDFDTYNVNALMDVTYQRLMLLMSQKVPMSDARVVIDDYNIGPSLDRYLIALKNGGAEVVREHAADDNYLEARVASLIAKHEQQKVLEAVRKNQKFQVEGQQLGSGNAGDSRTLAWLKAWHEGGQEWPWFVKRSFKTIGEIEGRTGKTKKRKPTISEGLLDPQFVEKFQEGRLNVQSLAVVCPNCGVRSKSVKLIPVNARTTAICIECGKPIPEVSRTLRYYCGQVMPDSNVIIRGTISKDLEGARFLEGFTILVNAAVRRETDNHGGKKEFERLAKFASMNRIRLEETGTLEEVKALSNQECDDYVLSAAVNYQAILIVADNQMKGLAQARGLFVFEL